MTQEAILRPAEIILPTSQSFRVPVTISSLPYEFTGRIPTQPTIMHWKLNLPKPSLDTSPTLAGDILIQKPITSFDGDAYIAYLGSQTDKVTDENYRNARGVGSFLLDNFLGLADIRSWRVSMVLLYPDLDNFFRKRGFVAHFDFMIREPQPPTGRTEIARILQFA